MQLGNVLRKLIFSLSVLMAIVASGSSLGGALPSLPENASVKVTGTLDIFVRENLQSGEADYEFFLTIGNGAPPIQLLFADGPPTDMRSGIGLTVRGLHAAGRIQVSAAEVSGGTSSSTGVVSAAGAVEDHGVAVIMVDLTDAVHSSSEIANMAGYYFGASGSMKDMYHQISFGQLNINGDLDNLDGDSLAEPDGLPDVVGPVSTGLTSAEMCSNPFSYVSTILSAAQSQGLNAGFYQHRIYALPRNMDCGWTGYANVGCSTCNAFNIWSHDLNTTSHEFGHNIGFAHASTDGNNDGTIDGEYNDFSSFMGYSLYNGVRALDGAHHWQAGWYGQWDPASIQTTSSSGSYVLAPLQEGAPSTLGVSVLRVNVPNGRPYFLSVRQALGYDADLPGINSAALNGINIHRYNGSGYDNTRLIAQLGPDQEMTDSANNLTIRQIGSKAGDGTVNVQVDIGGQSCVEANPGLSLSPLSATVAAGGQYSFQVTVDNRDSGPCDSVVFSLFSGDDTVPFDQLRLAAGASHTVDLNVSGGFVEEIIPIAVRVQAAGKSEISATASLVVDMTAPENVASLQGVYEKKGRNHRVQLDWNASSSPDVAEYAIYRDGVLLAKQSQTGFTDTLDASSLQNVYDYRVTAVDAVGNESVGSTVAVDTTGGDTGGNNGGGKGKGNGNKP